MLENDVTSDDKQLVIHLFLDTAGNQPRKT